MHIAKRTPFAGKPVITTPSVLGCSPDKPFFWRLTAIGARPIRFTVTGLPQGLSQENALLQGILPLPGCFFLHLRAENAEGSAEKTIRLEVFPGACQRTPLLGFTTWNAYERRVTQEDVLRTGCQLNALGLADYGYVYVNLDSSWQGAYGGTFDAIQPCDRFPDMAEMVRQLHAMGLKSGIYSTPFLEAWGCPPDRKFLPGCTTGHADLRFPLLNGGIGSVRKEENNVAQWTDWGIDYLKYDWLPTDTVNADRMRRALTASPRDFVYCVTVRASLDLAEYWRRNVNSWRCNGDTNGKWEAEKTAYDTYPPWQDFSGYGHYYDLDMLSIGKMRLYTCEFTDEEKLFQYTARAFLNSPVQLSCLLDEASDWELDLFSNEEIIAVNQDGMLAPAKLVWEEDDFRLFAKPLENGDTAYGLFNASDATRSLRYELPEELSLRDLWQKAELGRRRLIELTLPPHCAAVLRASR